MVPLPPPSITVSEPTDGELAHRVVHGPRREAAFDELYARHAARVLAILRVWFSADAEELAQEAWTRAFAQMRKGEIQELTNFRAWLIQIGRRAGIDAYRKGRLESLGSQHDVPDARLTSPLEPLLDTERRDVLRTCLEKLDDEYRAVIVASAGGEDPKETAGRLHMTVAVVYQRKSRALTALRKCAERHMPPGSE
jgi:RNA polymerase sigma factor (sigma-70 family)